MYSNTAFIPQPSAVTPGQAAVAQLYNRNPDAEIFSKGVYNWANSDRDTQCADEASRIFGQNLIDPAETDYAALMIGDAVLTRSGCSANPEAYFRAQGWTVPTGYGDYTNLTRIAGQRIMEQARANYDDYQKRLAEYRKAMTDSLNALPGKITDTIYTPGALGAEAIFHAKQISPEDLQSISKFYDKDKAVESHQRALTAWASFSGFMHSTDTLQSMTRENLRDIAAILTDESGNTDPLALAVLSLLAERRATAMQSENPEAWSIFADSLQNWGARMNDQDAKDKAAKWNTMVQGWQQAGIDQEQINQFSDKRYNDQAVETLYGSLQQALDTSLSPSEKADWLAKAMASAAKMTGESIVPSVVSLGIGLASRGAGFGAAASTLASYSANVAINSNSLINAAVAEAYRTGKANPEIYGRQEGSAQAITEGAFDISTSLPGVSKLVGKISNKAAATAAGSRFLTNQYARATLNYLGAGTIQGIGELAEEEMSGKLAATLNELARKNSINLTPRQYTFGESLAGMKSYEIAGIFGYTYALGLFGIPADYRRARTFAQNTDNLLKAGHSPAAVRDIQSHLFQAEDQIAAVYADNTLSKEEQQKQVAKINQDFFAYQQKKAQSDIWDVDPEIIRKRLEKENKKTLTEAELALAIRNNIHTSIFKDAGIIDSTAIAGDKYQLTFIQKGEKNADGSESPAKITTQEWSSNQLVNWLQIKEAEILDNSLRKFQSLVQAHAGAQTITLGDLRIEFQNMRETPLAAFAALEKHNAMSEDYIREMAITARNMLQSSMDSGMTAQEAAQQPSGVLRGVSLGEVAKLDTSVAERKEQASQTSEGESKGITADTSVSFPAMNIRRADGSYLIAYVAGDTNINDMLEDMLETHIKHQLTTGQITRNQLAGFLKEVDSHLPGKSILPKNKTDYSMSDLVEAYSSLAMAHYLYNEQYLPLTQGGHQLMRNIGRVVDTARTLKTLGDSWFTYANSEEGKAYLADSGKDLMSIMQEAGFTFGNILAQARATAQHEQDVREARNYQPDIEQEVKALMDSAQQEQQLAEINQQEAQEPITIPADQSITGKEITVEKSSEQATLVSSDDTPESHLRNLIQQGKATIRDFADFFKDHDITEAQATELGIRPLGQNGEPTYTYKMGLRLGIGMRFGTYTSEEQIQNFIIGALVNERVREIAGEDTTSYKLERKAEAVRKNARIFRDTASASRAKYNQAKAAGGSLPMPEAPQWPAPKKKTDNSQDNIVNILAPMTSKDKYRDFMTVIHKETKDGITSYVATDGTRLSMLSRKASAKEDSHIVINPKTKEEDNAENYATLHWRQVIPTKADIETTIDLAPMLALKNFRKKGGTKAGFRLTSAGTTHRSVIIKAEDHTVFVDAFRFREAVEQLANLSKTLGFPSTVKLSLLKESGPITLSASHNGWEWKALIMPLRKADESAGDIILSEKPTILASVEKHSEDYIEKLRQDAEYDEAKAQEFEDEAANLEEQARMLASVEAQLPENDRLARWVASYFERPRMSAIFDVIKTIRSGDVQKFMPWLTNPENDIIRKLYEKISGTKLPKNTDDYKAAVDKWVSTLHSTEDSPANFSIKSQQNIISEHGTLVPTTATESAELFTDGVLEAQNAIVTKPDVNFSIKAMHASPHNFRKFSTDFMGSGEGAQAYGWGLYFAESIYVNKSYFDAFNKAYTKISDEFVSFYKELEKFGRVLPHIATIKNKKEIKEIIARLIEQNSELMQATKKSISSWQTVLRPLSDERNAIKEELAKRPKGKLARFFFNYDGIRKALNLYIKRLEHLKIYAPEVIQHWEKHNKNKKQAIEKLSSRIKEISQKLDKLQELQSRANTLEMYTIVGEKATNYHVELNADDSQLLMWEKPVPRELHILAHKEVLLGNYEEVKDKVATEPRLHGHRLYKELRGVLGSQKAASEWLHAHGYKGIKFLDGNSRSAGEGTYNYVIFSGDDIKITAVNETGIWSMDEGWEPYTDPTANFSIRAANPSTLDRFTADPLGERIVHTVRTEARRYARVLGDKTPQEQAMNAIASAESIINAVDKYLHRPDKPVSRRHRNQLTKLRSIIEKYAQIIASGTPRSFKRISPAEQQELQAAIAELEAAELDTAETDPALLIEDDKRMNKRTREARSREHHRAIVREAAKGRVYKVLAAMLDTAADALDDYLKDQLLTKLHRLTATVAIKRTPSKRLKGKMTAPMYRELEQAIQLMAYSARQKEDAVDTILTAHETLAQAIASNEDNLTRGNTLLIELAHQLEQDGTPVTAQTLTAALAAHEARVAIFADITSKNYEQTRTAANAIYHIIRYGRALWQQKHEAREAEIQTYLSHFLANTTAEQGTEQATRTASEEEQKESGITRFANSMMNSMQLFHALSGIDALAPLMEHTQRSLATANVARDLHMKQMVTHVQAVYGRILGIKPATEAGYSDKQLEEISKKLDKFYAENNQREATGITRHYIDADGKHKQEELELTKWQALDLILTYRQQHYRPNAEHHGYTDKVLDALEKWCGTNLMELGEAMQKSLINDGTIAVYEEREGIPLRENLLYWPGHLNIAEQDAPDHPVISNPYHGASSYKFLKGRTNNLREVSARNAYNVWKSAIAERANYVYLAPVTDIFNSLLARKEFAARLKTIIGPSLYHQLKETLREIDGTTWAETSLQEDPHNAVARALRNMAPALLAGNPTTLIRQASAVANATLMPDFPPHEFAKQLVQLQQNQSGITIGRVLKLPVFQARARDNSALNEMLALGTDAKYSSYANLARKFMGYIDAMDTFCNAIGATIYYNYKYEQYTRENNENGNILTDAEIHAKCENDIAIMLALTAQPLKRTDKSAFFWRNSKTVLGPLYLYMGSELINKVGMARANWIKRKAEGMGSIKNTSLWLYSLGAGVGAVAFLTELAVAYLTGNTPDDDDSLSAWLIATYINSAYGQYTSQMPVIGQIVDLFTSPYSSIFGTISQIPGVKTIQSGKKIGKMLTDDKAYSGAEWQAELTRLARDLNGVAGYAGGVNSHMPWLTVTSSILQSITTAMNIANFFSTGVRNDAFYADWFPDWYKETGTRKRKPRRSKSKIEKWLTPDNK